jgi:hypothetical protein
MCVRGSRGAVGTGAEDGINWWWNHSAPGNLDDRLLRDICYGRIKQTVHDMSAGRIVETRDAKYICNGHWSTRKDADWVRGRGIAAGKTPAEPESWSFCVISVPEESEIERADNIDPLLVASKSEPRRRDVGKRQAILNLHVMVVSAAFHHRDLTSTATISERHVLNTSCCSNT